MPQTAHGNRQESADILYFQKNQMGGATPLSSFNQQEYHNKESQNQMGNPMNSYAQSSFHPTSRRSAQHTMYQTLQEPHRSQQHRHSAEPKLKNNKYAEYTLNHNQLKQDPLSQAYSKRALTGRTQDDEVVYIPHKNSHTRDSEPAEAKSSNSLSRMSRNAGNVQTNNFMYDQ